MLLPFKILFCLVVIVVVLAFHQDLGEYVERKWNDERTPPDERPSDREA